MQHNIKIIISRKTLKNNLNLFTKAGLSTKLVGTYFTYDLVPRYSLVLLLLQSNTNRISTRPLQMLPIIVLCLTSSLIYNTEASLSLPRSITNKTITRSRSDDQLFHWEDYCVLATMLIVSCAIGVFYGYFGEKQTTSDDFLLGGSAMGTFPMALSLAAR